MKMPETLPILHVPIDKLKISGLNIRENVGDISEMTDSIRSVGVVEPLVVRPDGKQFEIIVGSRRFSAAKKAGLKRIPAIVKKMNDDQAIVESLVENLQRGDISEEEIVRAFTILQKLDRQRWTQKTFGERLGKSQQWLSNLLLAHQSLVKLRQAGIVKGMASYPKADERERGIVPLEHLKQIERAMRSSEVREVLSDKQLEKKRKELAETVLELPEREAEKVVDRFRMYPEKPMKDVKKEALTTKSGIVVETYVKPSLARRIEEKLGLPVEEALPSLVQKGLEAFTESEERKKDKPIPKHWAEGLEQDPISVQYANWYKWNLHRIGNHYDFFTTHYSQKDLESFTEILRASGVKTLIDIRDTPFSQFRPEFNKENLAKALKAKAIEYINIPELGVPREQRSRLAKTNDWKELGQWYKKNAVPRLDGPLNGGTMLKDFHKPYAFMCVEKDPNRCHRQWIAEALEGRGLRSLDL